MDNWSWKALKDYCDYLLCLQQKMGKFKLMIYTIIKLHMI